MVWWFKGFAASAQDLSAVPSTSQLPLPTFPDNLKASSGSHQHKAGIWYTDTYAGKTHMQIKKK